jgi:hypothetical protein
MSEREMKGNKTRHDRTHVMKKMPKDNNREPMGKMMGEGEIAISDTADFFLCFGV